MQRTLIGVYVISLILSSIYLVGALGYPMGTMDQPGPGRYPVFVGILLLIASAGSLVDTLLKPAEGIVEWPRGRDFGRVLAVTAGTAAYAIMLPYAGHLIASVVTIFVVLHTMGLHSWPAKIGLAIAIALSSYYLFDVILNVPLPKGVLG